MAFFKETGGLYTVNYLEIYYSYYVYPMKKYTYCFGCDGKFGASDGIASVRRSSYFDLAADPDVSSERIFLPLNTSILGIVIL